MGNRRSFGSALLRFSAPLDLTRYPTIRHHVPMTFTTTPAKSTLEKIALLLRQAEGTDNEHEAEAFTAKAQQLATLHQIEIEQALRWVPTHERRESPTMERVRIGPERQWGLPQYCDLFMAIGKANALKFRIYTDYTAVLAIGFPSDMETTKVLYASLLVQMVEATARYLKRGEWKSEKTYREGTKTNAWGEKYKDWGYFPVTNRQARASFMDAYASRIGQRLGEARDQAIKEAKQTEAAARRAERVAEAAQSPSTPWDEPFMDFTEMDTEEAEEAIEADSSVALVLAAKHDKVEKFYDDQYGKADRKSRGRGSWASKANTSVRSARGAGVTAANSARLSSPKGVGGSKGALGR